MIKSTEIKDLSLQMSAFAVLRTLHALPLFRAFFDYARAAEGTEEKLSAYGAFVSEIYAGGGDLAHCVKRALFSDENVYVRTVGAGLPVSAGMQKTAQKELAVLSRFASLTSAAFAADLGTNAFLPAFETGRVDLLAEYEERIRNIGQYGYGIFAENAMFMVGEGGEILPIESPDGTTLDRFVGYEKQREKVLANTEAFLAGRPAANALLYGDAGTGKSSTVKAVVNHFFDRGLRLIEIRKNQLLLLPKVMGAISKNPLKFILFIDDLSFNQSDDQFSMLKAMLEGSACARAGNAVIYATSNRRHIVRETFSDREGDEIHKNDTVQETLSLSERFGLTVLFARPEKKLYLEIVESLARRHGLLTDESFFTRAEEFALRRGYRSARCAEQFVESLL